MPWVRARIALAVAVGLVVVAAGGAAARDRTKASSVIVFSPQGNDLDVYAGAPPFKTQTVVRHRKADPKGWDINGQVCFLGRHRFIAGEDTNQPNPPAGWGVFRLTGEQVGAFKAKRVARLVPTREPTDQYLDTYGCGVLSDGRVVTTVIGNNASGPLDGQLVIWFPPFNSDTGVKQCKLDASIGTAMGIYVDKRDRIYVASARGDTAGILRFSPPYPKSARARDGCGARDAAGSPMAVSVQRADFIKPTPDNHLASPNAIVPSGHGTFYVSSVINGVIAELDGRGHYVRTVLEPPTGEKLGSQPFSTGTPLGLAVAPDGTLYYADLGLVIGPEGPDTGAGAGTVRRIRLVHGKAQPPQLMARGLDFPDGLGVFSPNQKG